MNHTFDIELRTNETESLPRIWESGVDRTLLGWEMQRGKKVCVQKYMRILRRES
jgi:hypothetical protein